VNIKTIFTKRLRWIDVVNPGPEEIEWLRANFRFHNLHFQAVSQHQHRTHIDEGEGYDFIVLLFPVYDRSAKEIIPGEVDFFVGPDFLITVHYNQIYTLKALFNETRNSAELRTAHMQKGSGFLLYKILDSLFRRSYPILDHISEDITEIEQGIFHNTGVDLLSKIALMKKNIIEFRKMMKTHHYVLAKLPKRTVPYLNFPQSKLYYRDLLEYFENIWDILEALKETADTLADTNQSLVAHRLNQLTRNISIISAIVLPATLVAFLFVIELPGRPFHNNPFGFWIVGGLMALSSLLMLWLFKHKKWF